MNRIARAAMVALFGLCAACTQHSAEQEAQADGLTPVDVAPVAAAPIVSTPPIISAYLRSIHDQLPSARQQPLPTVPPRPNYDALRQMIARTPSTYTGWTTDRIDASSFDSLTNSVNAIYQKMGPEAAEQFDRIIKFVMMNVTRNPLVAKKAATGDKVSDQELLQLTQSYLDGRTPAQVTELAERLLASQQPSAAQAASPGFAVSVPSNSSDVGAGIPGQ